MRYRELLAKLQGLTSEQLDKTVTIFDEYTEEYCNTIDFEFIEFNEGKPVLDIGDPFLRVYIGQPIEADPVE
ncbi:MAG: hypothetical protein ACHQ6U_10895 [Thermodesulfobacteriota bacterium]